MAVKIEVNQIRGRLPIVTDDVAHQDIENVVVDGDGFAKSRHGAGVARRLQLRYTDKRTALSAQNGRSHLDAKEATVYARAP